MEPVIDGAMFSSVIELGAEGLFYLITLIFLFFSLSFAYHWFAYSTNKAYSIIMLAIYLGVSAILFISMMLSLNAL